MDHSPAPLPEIVDRVIAAAEPEVVTFEALVQSFGRASFTPILLLPAVAVATPLSGIPFFSSLMGAVIALVSVQMLLRRRYLWLPHWVLNKSVPGARVRAAFTWVRPAAVWAERHTAERLKPIVRRPFVFIPQLICLCSGLAMPVLEFVPFSSSVVGVGVMFLALGMLARDGLLTLLALLPYGLLVLLVLRMF